MFQDNSNSNRQLKNWDDSNSSQSSNSNVDLKYMLNYNRQFLVLEKPERCRLTNSVTNVKYNGHLV